MFKTRELKLLNFKAPNTNNGLNFSDVIIPEELLVFILSFVSSKDLLHLSLVCKQWFSVVRSPSVWYRKYERKYKKPLKKLPWFVYYCLFGRKLLNNNLLYTQEIIFKPHNTFKRLSHIIKKFIIPLDRSELMRFVVGRYRPSIYVSETVAGIFRCGCVESLRVSISGKGFVVEEKCGQGSGKMEILIDGRFTDGRKLHFIHDRGIKLNGCAEHYTSNVINGEVIILFDTLHEIYNDKYLQIY